MSDLQSHLAVLADPTRVRLLALLDGAELDVGELTRALNAPQSTVSRHLKALRVAGWIHRRAEGTSGLFRMAADLPEAARTLWALVRDDFLGTDLAEEDAARLQVVLTERLASASFFQQLGSRWEGLRRALFGDAYLLPTLLSLLPEGLVVVDLGCGTGEVVAALAPFCASVIGVDQEQAMLDVAGARTADLSHVTLHRADLAALPLPDQCVDVALCMLVLHHLDEPSRVLSEASRVLRPGGRVVVLDMVAHDRDAYRQTMGHRHLGFTPDVLARHAAAAHLRVRSYHELPATPEAQAPPLFVAVLAGV